MTSRPGAEPVVQPAEAAYRVPADLARVRDFVRAGAVALGLSASRADLLAVAISELATNTLQHTGGGGGLVRLWSEPGAVRVEVVDGGDPPGFGRDMPPADQLRGRGLAIVERICDEVGIAAVPGGTLVRVAMLL